MRVVEKIKAFFRGGKAAAKVEPKPASGAVGKKTAEASGQEGTKEQGT